MTEPSVSVGIVGARRVGFRLNAAYRVEGRRADGEQVAEWRDGGIAWRGRVCRELLFEPVCPEASFALHDVVIGRQFHWERAEEQVFRGCLRLVADGDLVRAVNVLPVEDYLASVISSEMSADASLELLKAHAVVSRGWLLAQMARRAQPARRGGADGGCSTRRTEGRIVRWYDRDDHALFDVCADDHCQRYQGITRATNARVGVAVDATRGQVLTYGGEICDTRFSKCCGGTTETFSTCWDDVEKPYLVSAPDPYCDTRDAGILSRILNGYDRETTDFYRWSARYTWRALSELVARKLGVDFGEITGLVPLERGPSGRISLLRIVGTRRTLEIGKELEVRRALSETHLLSSAFEVEHTPDGVVLHGRGWGHGVGLCQIGAAVMGERGFSYEEILRFYYHGAVLERLYT